MPFCINLSWVALVLARICCALVSSVGKAATATRATTVVMTIASIRVKPSRLEPRRRRVIEEKGGRTR
jgi:hypothetical protein